MANADVEIRLRLNNEASQGVKKAEQDAQKGAEKTATATERAAAKAATAAERGAAQQRNAYKRTAQAREQLGIRSERTIQREIDRTVAAYNRLARSGTASWREQSRAAEQMRQRVTQLTNEMGRLTAKQKAVGALKGGASMAAGIGAAGMVLKSPISKAMSFDERLAHIANNAFAERDREGRIQGIDQLRAAVNSAVMKGGVSQDSAADTMDTLVSSSLMSVSEASKMLPELAKAATASGADISELTDIALSSMRTFAITAEEIPNILNQAVAAGQAGGFTLSGLAQFLPRHMAQAAASGMSGRSDFASLAALNQAALRTAGNQEEAGRNVQTILSLLNDKSVAEQLKKKTGVNLSKHLQSEKAKGVSSLDAFAGLLQKSVEKNSGYKALQVKLASAKNDEERTATLEGMAAIAQRSSIGNIVTNRRAMMALLAMMNEQGYMQDVRRQIMENDVASGGAVDRNFEVIASRAGFKTRQAGEALSISQQGALGNLNEKIGEAAEAFSTLAGKYPELIGATTLATTALTAFAGATGLATIAMGGKGIGIGKAAGAAKSLGAGAVRAVAGGAARIAATQGMSLAGGAASAGAATTAAGVAAAGAAGYATGKYLVNPALNYAAKKATGSEHETFGTWLYSLFNGDKEAEIEKMLAPTPLPQKQDVDINAQLKVGLAPGLVLQGQSVQTSGGGNIRMDTGNLVTGAP
ncbi:MAG: phage tail tape measure protein [Betaproteobacteria bacterium]|nr:phage tail tape measure protein [Betaproteobacteria bacterium]